MASSKSLLIVSLFLGASSVAVTGMDTCANNCGQSGGDDCWCDHLCTGYEDCCDDFNLYCDIEGNPLPEGFATEVVYVQPEVPEPQVSTGLIDATQFGPCNEQLIEKNPGDPDLPEGAITCDFCNGDTVMFTVTQKWADHTIFCVQTIYKKDGVDYECSNYQKAGSMGPDHTFTRTAECADDGFAYVILVPRDYSFDGVVQNEWSCPAMGQSDSAYKYSLRIPCDCQDQGEYVPEFVGEIIPDEPDCSINNMWNLGGDHCPEENGVTVLNVEGTEPTNSDVDILWAIQEMDGSNIRMKIRNPFDSEMRTFVRYKKQVGFGPGSDLTCTEFTLNDCEDETSESLEVSCFSGIENQLTLVEVYFVDESGSQDNIFGGVDIDECCHAGDPPPNTVAMYSFQVRCMCWEMVLARHLRQATSWFAQEE